MTAARRPSPPSPFAARAVLTCGLLAAAFAAGRLSGGPGESAAFARQDDMEQATSDRIKEGFDNFRRAQDALQQSGRYVPAAGGVNCFVTLAGGYDVLGSLRNGRGVDPETYCALEAGFAPQEVLSDLGRDASGRLTYRDELVRLLPRGELRTLYLRRAQVLGEAL